MFKRSLHNKIIFLVVGLISIGVIASIYWELSYRKKELLVEELRSSRMMARPVISAINEVMLEGRPDLARKLVASLGEMDGVEDIYVVRSNGTEEAFRDFSTIRAVREKTGAPEPALPAGHPADEPHAAPVASHPEFRKAFEMFKRDWSVGPLYFVDSSGAAPVFTYLHPIENSPKCASCHSGEDALGILVVRTSLEPMFATLAKGRNQWIISGILATIIGAVLLSLLIKRSVTGPVQRTVEVLKRIAEGNNGMRERVEVTSGDEIGYLATSFNNMLETIEKRDRENKKLFELIAKSKEEWVATFDAIQDFISIHDRDYRILKVNKALARRFNAKPEQLIGRKCHDLLYASPEPDGRCPHVKTIETGEIVEVEVEDMAFGGTYTVTTFPVFNNAGEVWASVHVARDTSQEKLLREQLLHAEKLSSVGKLVAGIAHELNNPLMGIMGFSQILMDLPGDKTLNDVKGKLHKIYHESLRTAKIVQNLLTFARAKKTERAYNNINEILRHTLELREYSLNANNIEVALKLDENLPRTMVDMFQLQQVFINIINNAEDAMVADKGSGKLEISSFVDKGRISVVFADDGPGIPRDIINMVFDPFFTTKEVGKGTGLGLSITHGIVTEHGGAIDIAPGEDGGTVVTVELPILERERIEVKSDVDEESAGAAGSGEHILVVDDEKSVREALSGILVEAGFKVQTAREGREALDILGNRKFDLVISDVKMPGVGGMDLFNSIMHKHRYLKDRVIMLTGDVFSDDIKGFFETSGAPYVLKPFEPKELIGIIKKLL